MEEEGKKWESGLEFVIVWLMRKHEGKRGLHG